MIVTCACCLLARSLTDAHSKIYLNIFIFRIRTNHQASWSTEIHRNEMYSDQPLTNWAIIYPNRFHNEVTEFVRLMQDAARGMQYEIRVPT